MLFCALYWPPVILLCPLAFSAALSCNSLLPFAVPLCLLQLFFCLPHSSVRFIFPILCWTLLPLAVLSRSTASYCPLLPFAVSCRTLVSPDVLFYPCYLLSCPQFSLFPICLPYRLSSVPFYSLLYFVAFPVLPSSVLFCPKLSFNYSFVFHAGYFRSKLHFKAFTWKEYLVTAENV